MLIFGQSTSGKTYLARKLVENGLYDLYLEADDFWRYVSGIDKAWRLSNPNNKLHRRLKNKALGLCLKELCKQFRVVACGLWAKESLVILEMLQDYDLVVLTVSKKKVGMERWLKRQGNLKEWEASGVGKYWDENNDQFLQFARQHSKKLLACRDTSEGFLEFDDLAQKLGGG
jgi:hypothetical protein